MSVDTDSFDGACDVWEENVRRSRVDRRCHACFANTIRRGDLYYSVRQLFDGRWECINRCARCQAMFRFLSSQMGSYEVCDQKLNCGHKWEDNFDELPPVVVQALPFLTHDEAQILLTRWPTEDIYTPREKPELTIARLLGWARKEAANG